MTVIQVRVSANKKLLNLDVKQNTVNIAMHAIRQIVRKARRTTSLLALVGKNAIAHANKNPVFILGNQKSGTSAICSLLGFATGLSVSNDLRREIGKQYYLRLVNDGVPFSKLVSRNRLDFSRDIIKEPNLALFFNELKNYFPLARFAIVIRDPRDNIRSILNRVNVPGNLESLGKSGNYRIDPGFELVLGDYFPAIRSGNHYIEQLAERWNYFFDVYSNNKEHLVLIRYEDFNKDKPRAIAGLAEALGLEQKYDISDKVDIQFQSRGNRTISWQDFFGDENLLRIEKTCYTRMASLGYTPALYRSTR